MPIPAELLIPTLTPAEIKLHLAFESYKRYLCVLLFVHPAVSTLNNEYHCDVAILLSGDLGQNLQMESFHSLTLKQFKQHFLAPQKLALALPREENNIY